MVCSVFNYSLPPSSIAQRPVGAGAERARAKLLHAVSAENKCSINDRVFAELPELLCPADLLILNDTRVLPYRFFVKRPRGQEGQLELLLLKTKDKPGQTEVWEAVGRPLKKIQAGDELELNNLVRARVLGRTKDERRLILELSSQSVSVRAGLAEGGLMPIPPYIRRGKADAEDVESYQTVYAAATGSVAAPTAGLHFTEPLLTALNARGVDQAFLTLHVGAASFTLVEEQSVSTHQMESEEFMIPFETKQKILQAKDRGGRVIAVGTTSTRALESSVFVGEFPGTQSNAACEKLVSPGSEAGFYSSELFITPGFKFQLVDALITNFHQPRSTHLLLVAALIGEENLSAIYEHALASDYRFLSYGDAMLLEKN